MANGRILLTKEQRACMAAEVAFKAGYRLEEFDAFSETVVDDLVRLSETLAPYVHLVRELRTDTPITDVELLGSIADEVRIDTEGALRLESRALEQLLGGAWDYIADDTPEQRSKVESQTRRIIAEDRRKLAISHSVLRALSLGEPSVVAS
jgi:hypothetical protein